MPKLKQLLGATSGAQLMDEMTRQGKIVLEIDGKTLELDGEDIQVRLSAKEGWAAAQGRSCVVALNTELTPELVREGIAKDAIRLIQDLRKRRQCNFTDRIAVTIQSTSDSVREALREHRDFICAETLSAGLEWIDGIGVDGLEPSELADEVVWIELAIVPA